MLKRRIDYNLECVVDYNKDDRKREFAYCYIARNGVRVAQVRLNPVRLEEGHSLERNEIDYVLYFVDGHKYELERAYENQKICSAN